MGLPTGPSPQTGEAGAPAPAYRQQVDALVARAAALVAPPKGILAAGHGAATMSARLAAAGLPPTAEHRRAFRELLVTAPGMAAGLTGVILAEETLGQRLRDGRTFPAAAGDAGLMTGVRVDTGRQPLPGTRTETITQGLDGLPARLDACAGRGAAFAVWRAVLRIGPGMPSHVAVRANAQALGRYAAACQEAGLVPVVQPEITADGTHSPQRCEMVTSLMLAAVMSELQDYAVDPGAVVLMPNMALPGRESGVRATAADIAEATVRALDGVPVTLAGVAFPSGGEPPERATEILARMQSLPHVWPLTFAFGRALTDPALAAWRGDPARQPAGQRALAHRVAMNIAAMEGRYPGEPATRG